MRFVLCACNAVSSNGLKGCLLLLLQLPPCCFLAGFQAISRRLSRHLLCLTLSELHLLLFKVQMLLPRC
jgi:hypothetical protein